MKVIGICLQIQQMLSNDVYMHTFKLMSCQKRVQISTVCILWDALINVTHPPILNIASANAIGGIKIWDVYTGDILQSISGQHIHTNCVCYSPDNKYIAFGID